LERLTASAAWVRASASAGVLRCGRVLGLHDKLNLLCGYRAGSERYVVGGGERGGSVGRWWL